MTPDFIIYSEKCSYLMSVWHLTIEFKVKNHCLYFEIPEKELRIKDSFGVLLQ